MKKRIIDNTKLFAAREGKKKERLEQVDRHNALFGARKVWETWIKRVKIQSRKLDELPVLLNELAADLEREVKDLDIRKTTIDMVHGKLVQIYGQQKLMEAMVRVMIDCPHEYSIDSDCGWGGVAFFGKAVWDEGKAEMACPECGRKLTKADMILAKDLEEMKASIPKVNRIAKYVPSRVAKNKPPEVFQFRTVEDLEALPFVRAVMKEPGFVGLRIMDKYLQAQIWQQTDPDRLLEVRALGIIEHPELVKL